MQTSFFPDTGIAVASERTVEVNPEVLRWARETAGLSLERAAKKLGIRTARGFTPEVRLRHYEAGISPPPRTLLPKMVAAYQQPLVIFYAGEPPQKADRGTDFRTIPEAAGREWSSEEEAWLDHLLRDLIARQSTLRAGLIDSHEGERLAFVGSLAADDVDETVEYLKNLLGITHADYHNARDMQTAFRLLRNRVEETGVFVLLIGDLGHHTRTIGVDVFRGLAMADDIAPLIVVNPGDSHGARAFTLLHEMVHLCLGHTGISDWSTSHSIEKFCSDVASRFLLPEQDLSLLERMDHEVDEWVPVIKRFAASRNLSAALVSYRLFRSHTISRDDWLDLRRRFSRRWQAKRMQLKEARKNAGGGGPGYYTMTKYRLGDRIIETTGRLMRSEALSTTKAGFVLGVRPRSVGPLLEF